MAKTIMIQGTMSNAGKSLLAAGLCRVLKQDGYRVAPFKSQNMALNSFITKDGGEMGRAQVVQAEAAGIEPDVRMNPILLKPTTDVGSQVIVNGRVQGNMPAMEYYRRKRDFIPAVMGANILTLKDAIDAGIDFSSVPVYLVGVVVAAVSGYASIRLLRYVADKGRFGAFAYYCWAAGVLTLVLTILH